MSDAILDRLRGIVGDAGLLTGADVAARRSGWLTPEPTAALGVVRPATTAETAEVMQVCHAAGQVVIPVGGNTGLVCGTLSNPSDLLLSTERMTAIEEVDTAGNTMTAEAGVPLQAVQDAAAAADRYFALDLGARGTATVGGTISTNAGGNAVIRYGMMREQVLGIEAVLADGTVVSSMNRMLKNNAGYDLKQLFIGTEGTLGIVTRAVLRLRPAMPSRNCALLAVDDYDAVPVLLATLGAALGGGLSAFEVLWADFYELILQANDTHQAPLPAGHGWYILVEARGGDPAGDAGRFEAALGDAIENELVADAVIATSGARFDALWAIRDDIDTLTDELDPVIAFDISLPISHAAAYADAVRARLGERWPATFRCATFGHLGDGNLHFVLTVGSRDHREQEGVMDIVYEELQPYGGSISAEHGIGIEKRPWLGVSRSEVEIALMRRLKSAFDPDGILNPGKVFT